MIEFHKGSQDVAAKIEIWMAGIQEPQFNWSSLVGLQIFCATNHKEPLAFIGYRELGDSIEILSLATHPQFRRSGLMKRTFQEFLANLPAGIQKILLEVHEANVSAVGLYEKLGFKVEGRRANYYKDGAAALTMTKLLR